MIDNFPVIVRHSCFLRYIPCTHRGLPTPVLPISCGAHAGNKVLLDYTALGNLWLRNGKDFDRSLDITNNRT